MPDETPSVLTEHIHAAARADLEFQTSLTAARHHFENLLNAFSQAVCNRDVHRLGELTGTVAVSLNGDCQRGDTKHGRIIAWFGHENPATTQTITNISLRLDNRSVIYSATYQDWVSEPAPRCTAMGTFQGRLHAGPQVWRWQEHTINKFSDLAELSAIDHHLSSPPVRQKRLQRTS